MRCDVRASSPRFAITSTPEQLKAAGELYHAYPDVYMHTHVSENLGEVGFAKSLFPASSSYLNIYKDHGLMGPRSVFAHGIHLSNDEFQLLAENNAAISFCPTSNLFLGSGLFKLKDADAARVRVGLGTDVGAGTSFSMIQTMNEAYKVIQMHKAYAQDPKTEITLTAFKAFYLATLGSARALHLDDRIGSLQPGREADIVVLNPAATPLLDFRLRKSRSLADRLFAMMTIADDRAVEAVYLMGKKHEGVRAASP